MGTVVVPHVMSQALSSHHILCHECCHCVAMVGVVLQLYLLCGCGECHCAVFCVTGAIIAWLQWALYHMAVVGIMSHCRSGCHRAAFYVAGAVVAWPW